MGNETHSRELKFDSDNSYYTYIFEEKIHGEDYCVKVAVQKINEVRSCT